MNSRRVQVVRDLPPDLQDQIDPTLRRRPPEQPSGSRTNYQDPPFADEWREEKSFFQQTKLLSSTQFVTLLSLQRAWPMVGFGILPGNFPGGAGNTINAFVFALVRGPRVAIAALTINAAATEAVGQVVQCGARAELVIVVTLALPGASVTGIQANLWGSPFR